MTLCWGVTDGSAGMISQVQALAIAMNLQLEMKIISLKRPWSLLPNICYNSWLKSYILSHAMGELSQIKKDIKLYPDMIISCGRKATLVAVAIKNANPRTRIIHIQDPQMSPANFDVVVAMEHDKINGNNVIKTRFALHSITVAKLIVAKEKFMPLFSAYQQPYIAVLLGGSTNKYRLTESRMMQIIYDLQKILSTKKCSLLITTSRRTGKKNIVLLERVFAGNKNVYIYNANSKSKHNIEENPYIGLLACADEIIVSNDSVNMMSEAFSTGKPVTILHLKGHKNTKPALFAEMVKSYPPMTGEEMQDLAQIVKDKLHHL